MVTVNALSAWGSTERRVTANWKERGGVWADRAAKVVWAVQVGADEADKRRHRSDQSVLVGKRVSKPAQSFVAPVRRRRIR